MTNTGSGAIVLAGGGKMGSALLTGWLKSGVKAAQVYVVEPEENAAQRLTALGVTVAAQASELPEAAETIIFAVKPQIMNDVVPDYRRLAGAETVFLSIAAGCKIALFESHLGAVPVVRAMPNTPAAIGLGMTVACANQETSDSQKARCQHLLEAVGEVAWAADEALMDPVTAVSGTHVCLRRVDPARMWQLFGDEGVTHYCGAPTLQIMLMNHSTARRLDLPVTVCVAGAPPSPTLLEQLKGRNFRPIHAYGLTETYGPTASCAWHREWDERPAEEQARLLARQGQNQIAADRVRVVDDAMGDVPRDGQTMGEIVMRGNIVMKGYYDDPDGTATAFRGGWFHSGDLGVWHPDGYVELRDRKKDIIICGGENISTIEVEQTVAKYPAVLECAVIAVPDQRWGERPKAFVTLKPGQSATEREIIAFCREYISHYKCPATVAFGELPKTSTGKVQKFVLREKEWVGRKKRIN